MSLDSAFAALLEPLLAEVKELRAEVSDLKRHQLARSQQLGRPVYDANQLQKELGFSHHQAYELLRARGFRRSGRLRITVDALSDYISGREPGMSQAN